MKRLWILVLALIFSGCGKPAAGPAAALGHSEDKRPCDDFIASLPADYVHGWVDSVEEPGNAASPKLRIFYYYRAPLRGEPTLFINGGPGSSSHGVQDAFDQTFQKLNLSGRMSIIYMDQRGTGCSGEYPADSDDGAIMERARWYGSRGIVADAEAIRSRILGDQPWSILGQSYGAVVAHRYAILSPQHLNKIIAYAGVPVNDPVRFGYSRIREQFATWDRYFQQYPDDRARVQTLLTTLTADVCGTSDHGKICGYELISGLVGEMLGFMDSWTWIHQDLAAMVKDGAVDYDAVGKFAGMTVSFSTRPQSLSLLTISAYDWHSGAFDAAGCQADQSALAAEMPLLNFNAYLTECSMPIQLEISGEYFRKITDHFGARNDWMTFDELKAAMDGGLKGRFFLYSAEFDPYVPVNMFADEVAALGDRLVYRTFSDTAHEGFLTQARIYQDLLGVAHL